MERWRGGIDIASSYGSGLGRRSGENRPPAPLTTNIVGTPARYTLHRSDIRATASGFPFHHHSLHQGQIGVQFLHAGKDRHHIDRANDVEDFLHRRLEMKE